MAYTPTVTAVTAATSSTQLFSDKAGQVSARYVFNDSTAPLYLKFGTAASTTSFTVKVSAGEFYEFPIYPLYAGVVHGAWSAANGAARCTEVV